MIRSQLSLVALLLVATRLGIAQQPDRWRGLVLGEATPEHAAKALGAPVRTERGQKIRTPVDVLLDKQHRFDKLSFKNGEGFDGADLYFREGKLVAILIDLKDKVKAASLGSIYKIEFEPKASVIERGSVHKDYERREGKVYPQNFPSTYELIADTPTSWVAAYISNSGFGAALRTLGGAADDSMGYPGKCYRIWLISKSLRDSAGSEALK